jgi:hypothetical protein
VDGAKVCPVVPSRDAKPKPNLMTNISNHPATDKIQAPQPDIPPLPPKSMVRPVVSFQPDAAPRQAELNAQTQPRPWEPGAQVQGAVARAGNPTSQNFEPNLMPQTKIFSNPATGKIQAPQASCQIPEREFKPLLEIELIKHMGVIVSQLKEKNKQDNQNAELNRNEDKQEVKNELEADKEKTKHTDVKTKTTDLETVQTVTNKEKDAETATKNEESPDEDLKLGLLHTMLMKCVPPHAAIIVFLLITAAQHLIEASSDISMSILLYNNLFKTEAMIVLFTDFLTIPLLITHYVLSVMNSKIPWTRIWLEITVLVLFHPFAPTIAYFSWAMAKIHRADTKRYKNIARTMDLLRGLLLSPIQMIIITNLYLTDCLPMPWAEEVKICDSNKNCVPLGPFGTLIPIASFAWSAFSMVTTCSDAYKPDGMVESIDNIAFMLPVCLFKAGTILITCGLMKEYSVVILMITMVVNAIIIQKFTTKKVGKNDGKKFLSNQAVNVALTAITSIVLLGTFPEDDENNCSPEEKIARKKEKRKIATLTSFVSLFFLSATNVGVYIILNTTSMLTNPNMQLSDLQINHIMKYALLPLMLMSIVAITVFCLPTAVSWRKYVKLTLNSLTTAATIAGELAAIQFIPEGPQDVAVIVRIRDRVDFLSGKTWDDTWGTRKDREWTFDNFTFSAGGNVTIKERVMNKTQNMEEGLGELAVSVNVGRFNEEDAIINLVKLTTMKKFDMPTTTCIACKDESNSCNRLLQDVLRRNPHLKMCGQPVNGHWSNWTHKKCMTITEVLPGQHCGRGYQLKERTCQGRKYGGRYCSGPTANQSQCQGPPCPGKAIPVFSCCPSDVLERTI